MGNIPADLRSCYVLTAAGLLLVCVFPGNGAPEPVTLNTSPASPPYPALPVVPVLVTNDLAAAQAYVGPALFMRPDGSTVMMNAGRDPQGDSAATFASAGVKASGPPLIKAKSKPRDGDGPGEDQILGAVATALERAYDLWPTEDLTRRPLAVVTASATYAFNVPAAAAKKMIPYRTAERRVSMPSRPPTAVVRIDYRPAFNTEVTVANATDPRTDLLLAGISRAAGGQPILAVRILGSGQGALVRLAQTAVHEGIHMYGQSGAQSVEPDFVPDWQASMTGRGKLEELYARNPRYRQLVVEELHAAEALVQSIASGNSADVVREHAACMLRVQRLRGLEFGSLRIERYWYWMEGVPTYVQFMLDGKAEDGLLDGIRRNLLAAEAGESREFFALWCGASLWYARQALDPTGAWRHDVRFDPQGWEAVLRVFDELGG